MSKSSPLFASAFWSYAFRPFFLLNGIFAIAVMAIWVAALNVPGRSTLRAILPRDILVWHGHEMIFGFAMAAVAGFALTAVATWTGRKPIAGSPLALLVVAWVAGRGAMLFAGVLPDAITLAIDMAFPILLLILIGREVIAAGNHRNLPIVAIVALLATLNLFYHLGPRRVPLYLAVHVILVLITIIAGRIVPNFTANWMRARGHTRLPRAGTPLDLPTVIATVAYGLAFAAAPGSNVAGVLALAAALAHGLRLAQWRGLATTGEPLLFVLHVAYMWFPIGYLLSAAVVFTPTLPLAAMHALTMGAIGSMILAVTTRVALAHTGRKLHAARLTVGAYFLLTAAVVVRIAGGVAGSAYLSLIDLAAGGWILTFAIFTWVYWPVLTGPRID